MMKFDALEERVSAVIAKGEAAEFNEMALAVFEFQRECNAHYGRYCRALGVTDVPLDWREIPAAPQAAFKHAALRSFPEKEEIAAFRTSGTTGEGFGVHHFRSMRLYEEAVLRGWDLMGVADMPQVMLIPAPAAAQHSSLSYMMGIMKARAPGGEQHWCVREDGGLDLDKARRALEGRPALVLGTALAFLHWFERMDPVQLPAGSVAFETGGYKGSGRDISKPELYSMFRERLGLEEVINEYGMTELSSQFYARGAGGAHSAPPWVRAVVVDPSTGVEVGDGEAGVLRIYDLANLGSVIGVQTRDLAVRRGTGFELLGRDPAALPRGCSRAADEGFEKQEAKAR